MCNKCDVKSDSLIKLKNHERTFHMKPNSSQTEVKILEDKIVQVLNYEFCSEKNVQTVEETCHRLVKYPCFYCKINIVSENHLNEHRRKCRGTSRMVGVVGLPYGFSARWPPPTNHQTFSYMQTQPGSGAF